MIAGKVVEEADLEGAMLYNAPILIVPRREGAPRLVADFRKLNSLISPFQVSLPRIDDLVQQIASSDPYYISQCDLKSSYWQVPIHKDSRPLLTFTNPLTGQRLMYTSAPFGMVSSGSFLNHAVSVILSGLPTSEVMTFVDDVIIIHGKGQFQQHIDRLRHVFSLFRDYNVSLGPTKCIFGHNVAEFCGHRISKDGVQIMNKNRTKLLENYASPTSRRSLVRFLAMSGWFRKGIKNYAMRVTACRDIARKPDKDFAWTPVAEAELRDIIQEMLSPSVLAPIKPDRDFVVMCDASDFAVGYVIGQVQDDKQFKVNYYGGHQLPQTAQNWPIHQKEIFACISAIREHQPMFVGRHLTVVTDNCSLQNLKTMQNSSGRLSRWLAYLSGFNVSYKSIPGHRHVVPDALSRMLEDASDEMRAEFTPSALTDTDDYILAISSQRQLMNYDLFVVERPTTVESESAPIAPNVMNCDVAKCCVTDAAVKDDICQISTLNPAAGPFVTSVCEAQPIMDENVVDDEFFDCHEDGLENVNVVTRQSALLGESNQPNNRVNDVLPSVTNDGLNDDGIDDDGLNDATANQTVTVNDENDSSSGIVTDVSDTDDPSSIDFELEIKPDDYINDIEFADMYTFKSTGTLPDNDDAARKVMLIHDLFTLDETDGLLYRITIPRAKRERRVKSLERQVCLSTLWI